MRDYGKTTPRLWTGQLGKAMRGKSDAQAMAGYLTNCPHGNMIGLFHLPLAYAQADLGWPPKRIEAAIRWHEQKGLIRYDHQRERVWVVEAWRIELSSPDMASSDLRRSKVLQLLKAHLGSPLVAEFLARYPCTAAAIGMAVPDPADPPQPPASPISAPQPDDEEESNPAAGPIVVQAPIPDSLGTVAFLTTWQEFRTWRVREKRKRMTATAERRMLAKLEPYGPDVAVAALNEAMTNDWQGVFPEKVNSPAGGSRPSAGRIPARPAPANSKPSVEIRCPKGWNPGATP